MAERKGVDPADLAKLREPFPEEDIEWRLQQAGTKNGRIWGRCLAYVTNRAIQERLDQVCGPRNWQNDFRPVPGVQNGVLAGIGILVDGEWIWKWDGAEPTDIEPVKGAISGAMKRAGVQVGIGRYLYDLPEGWVEVTENGKYMGKTKEGEWFRWNPPKLPDWALPKN